MISNSSLISEATKARVHAIMEEMGYHPNMIARSLVSKITRIVGTLIPGNSDKAFQHPFFPEILRGITTQADLSGYNILLSNSGSPERETEVVDDLIGGGVVEGMILMSSRQKDAAVEHLKAANMPFVLVGRPDDSAAQGVHWVDNDNVRAGYELARYFIQKGHRQIAFIGVTPEMMVILDRLRGYRRALEENGIPFDERLVVPGSYMVADGYAMTEKLLHSGQKFTGLIASDDFQAYASIHCLMEHGLHIPQDVAVAGFNNVTLSEYNLPSLTSVEVNAYNLGKTAFELLFAQFKHKAGPMSVFVPTHIVQRVSC